MPGKKNPKKKGLGAGALASKDDEDSDVINTSGPATQLFKKQISEDRQSSNKRPAKNASNSRIKETS